MRCRLGALLGYSACYVGGWAGLLLAMHGATTREFLFPMDRLGLLWRLISLYFWREVYIFVC